MTRKVRKVNAARVCFGISRIGYTPASAICDIVDNAVSAQATEIHIDFVQKTKRDNRKNNVTEYLIIDNGLGMSSTMLDNALDLGSSNEFYAADTLSKFGLGLKSASFAQGRKLEVISGDGSSIHKQFVDLDLIEEEYFSEEVEPSDADRELIKKYFKDGKRGTIVRVSKIHDKNHPSVKSTIDDLKKKMGVIYYYFLKKDLHIYIRDEELSAFDPLFTEEAGDNNLDEKSWDGKTVQWIYRPDDILIDPESNVRCNLEITMLPHPQVFKGERSAEEIRNKYMIGAQDYGFFVYRNRRLINWANRLDNIIPQDQDYYAFKGRINIDDTADDAFNIDVSKSHISLSEIANKNLSDTIAEYKAKCKKAWNNAWNKFKSITSESTNEVSNKLICEAGDSLEEVDYDESENFDNEYEKREKQIENDSRNKALKDTRNRIKDRENRDVKLEDIPEEEIKKTIQGSNAVSQMDKIFKVPNIEDNLLWEPYADAEKKECVRISTSHRFSKAIYERNSENRDMQIFYELMLFMLAKAECEVRKSYHKLDVEQISSLMADYRLKISEMLTRFCRKEEENLPPSDN